MYGGWQTPFEDGVADAVVQRQLNLPFDLLLGRKAFEIRAPDWPNHGEFWPAVNTATKYVASNTLTEHAWHGSVFLGGDVPGKAAALKKREGRDLHLFGSANVLQTLMRHDLVDEFWLKIDPRTLGIGKRLVAEETIPAAFRLTEG